MLRSLILSFLLILPLATLSFAEEQPQTTNSLVQNMVNRHINGDSYYIKKGLHAPIENVDIFEQERQLKEFDKHSELVTPEEAEEFYKHFISEEFAGIGVQLSQDKDTKKISVSRVLSDGPSLGILKKDDVVLKINDVEYTDMNELIKNVKGEIGTPVTLTIERDGEIMDVVIIRAKIVPHTVYFKELPNDILYIYVTQFQSTTLAEFQEALKDLTGIKGIIIDLRFNPGGFVNTVVPMVDMFAKNGTIITIDHVDNVEEDLASDDGNEVTLPIVVLINGYSASASEIFAQSLHELCPTVTLVGSKSYGKGSVQSTFYLPFNYIIKLTIGLYYTDSGYKVDGVGVFPDHVVDILPEDTMIGLEVTEDGSTDPQIDKAIEVLTGN